MEWCGESEERMNNRTTSIFILFPIWTQKKHNKNGEAYLSKATFPRFKRLLLERVYVLVACQDRITLNFLDRSFYRKDYNFRIARDQTVYFLTFLLFVGKKWTKWSQKPDG